MIDRENILPSDSLEIALDLNEHMLPSCEPYWELYRARISLSINTHYPEVNGAYYCNWRVLAALDEAIAEAGLAIVSTEYATGSTILPVEHLVAIDTQEPYLLLDAKQVTVGALCKWNYNTGYGGPFFSENLIMV